MALAELLSHPVRYIQCAHKERFLMTIAAAGHEHIVLPGELNIVCRGFLVMSGMPALDTIDVL